MVNGNKIWWKDKELTDKLRILKNIMCERSNCEVKGQWNSARFDTFIDNFNLNSWKVISFSKLHRIEEAYIFLKQ